MGFEFSKQTISGYDKLFKNDDEETQDLPVGDLVAFEGHPFKVLDDDDMRALIDSIHDNGILVPLLVRKKEDKYEILSGHRRHHAAVMLNLRTVPVCVRELGDDDATLAMLDSNLHRTKLLPSESAYSLKLKLDTLIHKRKTNMGNGDDEHAKAREVIGNELGLSGRYIQKLIRLTYLKPELLELVDAKKVPVVLATSLSYLDEEHQGFVVDAVHDGKKLTADIVTAMRLDPGLSREKFLSLFKSGAGVKNNISLSLPTSIKKFIPAGYSDAETEALLIRLVSNWANSENDPGNGADNMVRE